MISMIIAISGLTGSGKDTLGKNLAKALRYRHINPTFKDLARAEGVTLLEFQKRAARDPNIDRKFDRLSKKQAKGNCVATSWLSPWMLKADFRVYLFASLEERAKRIAKRDGFSLRTAMRHVQQRDAENRKRYLKLYGIDIFNTENFDVCLNSANFSPKKLAKITLQAIKVMQR